MEISLDTKEAVMGKTAVNQTCVNLALISLGFLQNGTMDVSSLALILSNRAEYYSVGNLGRNERKPRLDIAR